MEDPSQWRSTNSPATSVCERRAEQDGGQEDHNQSRRANPPKVCRNGGHDKDIRRDVSVWGPSEGRCVVRSMSSAKGGHHFGTARRHHMLQLAGHQQWVMADTAL